MRMNLLHHHHHHVYFQLRNKESWPCVSRMRCSSSRSGESERKRGEEARDRIITFGKYKGKMLGSLPSEYLKWVSSKLRAGDSEEWAKLADTVLQDPIYKDRIEWEMALNVLNGDNLRSTSSSLSPVSLLLDISDRFGWDYHDKLAWSKIDFDLLGTSKAARIPRRRLTHAPPLHHEHHPSPNPNPNPPSSIATTRRMQRRERQKTMRLTLKTQPAPPPLRQQQNNDDDDMMRRRNQNQNSQNAIASPFPGRQALLRNFKNH